MDDLDEISRKLEAHEDYQVLRKLKKKKTYQPENEVDKKRGIILDVETTGLDSKKDKVIELGMILFEFDKNGNIYRVIDEYNWLEDPGVPIPKEITKLTGITDEDVKGKKINDLEVESVISEAVLVIAHNASFDRPFIEKRIKAFENIHWACSLKQGHWKDHGFMGAKLEYIAYSMKFFYDAHRAIDDCWALLEIMSRKLPDSELSVLENLLSEARKTTYKISAKNAPFEMKDIMKLRGYQWDGSNKVWFTETDDKDKELAFLKENVYQNENINLPITPISGLARFSDRY